MGQAGSILAISALGETTKLPNIHRPLARAFLGLSFSFSEQVPEGPRYGNFEEKSSRFPTSFYSGLRIPDVVLDSSSDAF